MTQFGEQLRKFRQQSNDQQSPQGRLTQTRLGELLGEELGVTYSAAAISDWERGVTKIHADQRRVLVSLIKILHRHGGIKTILDANHFLESGNYRPLDTDEAGKIFVEIPNSLRSEQERYPKSIIPFLLEYLFGVSENEFKILVTKAKEEGPDPWWPRALAALMRKATDRFSLSLRTVLWVWAWLIAWWLIAPSLRLSFSDQKEMLFAMQKYVVGSLIVPLMIGLLINTKDSEYWRLQTGVNPLFLRLYTYQGAGIGFNVGYFFVFPFSLLRYYLNLESTVWIGILAVTMGLILGNMGARVVPHNLWRAFGRLTWADGAIFFVVALMGPLWAVFFVEFYPILLNPFTGLLVFLLAVTMMIITAMRKP